MYAARFGDVAISVASFDHEGGQDWASSSPHRGDRHVMQPRGERQRRTQCELKFLGGETALLAFDELAKQDTPHLFTHPVRGAYLAVVEGWTYSASADRHGMYLGRCTFVEYSPPSPPSPSSDSSAIGSAASVRVAADRAVRASDLLGLPTPEAGIAAATAERWSASDSIDARAVQADVTASSAALVERMNSMKPSSSDEWELYKTLLRTNAQLRQAALSVIADVEATVEYVVASSAPLLAIATRLYGGDRARDRADEIRRLNGVSAPTVPAGTRLKVPPP
ncbi:MAG: hypothetical protein ACRDBH_01450 [Bosea sp. (in: a-proteobacteria)]